MTFCWRLFYRKKKRKEEAKQAILCQRKHLSSVIQFVNASFKTDQLGATSDLFSEAFDIFLRKTDAEYPIYSDHIIHTESGVNPIVPRDEMSLSFPQERPRVRQQREALRKIVL